MVCFVYWHVQKINNLLWWVMSCGFLCLVVVIFRLFLGVEDTADRATDQKDKRKKKTIVVWGGFLLWCVLSLHQKAHFFIIWVTAVLLELQLTLNHDLDCWLMKGYRREFGIIVCVAWILHFQTSKANTVLSGFWGQVFANVLGPCQG